METAALAITGDRDDDVPLHGNQQFYAMMAAPVIYPDPARWTPTATAKARARAHARRNDYDSGAETDDAALPPLLHDSDWGHAHQYDSDSASTPSTGPGGNY